MNTLLAVFVFTFGLLIGSFLNVVIFRYDTRKGLYGRSHCLLCGTTLSALELVPLFSFLFLRGRCRECKNRISLQYPAVEFLSGLIFLLIFLNQTPPLESSVMLVAFLILLCISAYDIRHKIIPNGFVYSLIGLSFAALFIDLTNISLRIPSFFDAMSGPVVAFPLWFLWMISKGKWIGYGDAKLALGIGWLFGMSSGLTVLVFSFWIGAFVSLLLIGFERLFLRLKLNLKMKHLTIKTEIPFAPFLAAGAILVYFCGINLMTLLLF